MLTSAYEEDYFLGEEHEREAEEDILLAHLRQRTREDTADVVVNAEGLNVCVGGWMMVSQAAKRARLE